MIELMTLRPNRALHPNHAGDSPNDAGRARSRPRVTYPLRSVPARRLEPRKPEATTAADAWTALAQVQACVVHRIPGRVRLKVPGRRYDEAFFVGLKRTLLAQRGIVSVDINPLTASVLVIHDGVLDLCPGAGQPRRGDAGPPGRAVGRDTSLASVAINLVIAAAATQIDSFIVELCVAAFAHVVSTKKGGQDHAA